jgi:chromosome partitioning protein
MGKIIAIANQKGGVGKTTTAVNIAAGLVKEGMYVIGIDLDPQANMSDYLGYDGDSLYNISDLMVAAANNNLSDGYISQSIVHSREGIDYIPSNIKLAGADLFLSNVMCREQVLKRILKKEIFSKYDYVIIDCLPSLGILLTNALAAADSLIIPVQAQKFALDGLVQLEQVYDMVKLNVNPELKIDGVILTMADNTKMSKAVEAALESKYGDTLFVTRIHKRVEATNSTYDQKSLVSIENSVLGAEYKSVTKELIERSRV